jgi:riboflavin biosynthesis pyrimidine reductase
MESISTLYDQEEKLNEPALTPELRTRYGGDLHFPLTPAGRPYVVANFVSTLDGIVSFNIPGQAGGGQISGSDDADRFIMGLLRASADAVLVGAGTVEAVSPKHVWVAEFIYPRAKAAYDHYRNEKIRKPYPHPLIVIVSGSGQVDLDRSVFHTSGVRVLIITSGDGKDRLIRGGAPALRSTEIRELPAAGRTIDPHAILRLLKNEFGVTLLLHEGGPTLFGQFLAAGAVDELFLTMAPQIAGRTSEHPRPGLIAGVQFAPDSAPWLALLSAKQQTNHLYLRYRTSKKEATHLSPGLLC